MPACGRPNVFTNFFLAPPEIVTVGSEIRFVYHMEWPIVVMYGLCAVMIVRMFMLVWIVYKKNPVKASQLMPLLVGIILLFIGNLGITVFKNFPVDIVAGIFNAVLMFWMLYSGHVFKLTLLVSVW